MKTIMTIAISAALSLGMAFAAFATEYTKGTVKKLDDKAGKVTIVHEALKNLDMPAMTMVFKIGEGVAVDKLKAGSKIEFVADRVNGKLTITEVK